MFLERVFCFVKLSECFSKGCRGFEVRGGVSRKGVVVLMCVCVRGCFSKGCLGFEVCGGVSRKR